MSDYKIGDKVMFGRDNGEKTLGEIVKVNRVKLKVKQLEARGTMRDYPVGTVWTVPPSLCTPVGGAPSVAAPAPAKAKRPDAEILSDILNVYAGLSPENLSCDGECSRSEVARRRANLNRRLRELEQEIGRKVSEGEAYAVAFPDIKLPPLAASKPLTSWKKGDKVAFTHPTHGTITGTVERVNAKTVTLKGTNHGSGWRVSPHLLRAA